MTAVEFVSNRTYTLADFDPFVGRLGNESLSPLPNAEAVDPMAFLNNLASGGHSMKPVWGYALPNGSTHQRPQWTQLFLTTHMGGGLDGGGYAVTYGGQRFIDAKMYQTPIVVRFAICKHEKEGTGSLEQERRGYHPGSCVKCGMSLSYDSGD
jgi:hypothetical protein